MIRISKLAALFAAAMLAAAGTASAQQHLRVGLQDSEPGVIRDNYQLGGRDVDIWDAVTKDAGLHVVYVFMNNVPTLLAAMDNGNVDVVGWGVSRTSATEGKYLLTDTILQSAEALVVPKTDNRMYRGLDDINGLKFATLKASDYATYLKENGITEIKEFNTVADVLKAVTSGQANAALFSGLIAEYMQKQGKLSDLHVVSSYPPALARPIMAAFPKTASENYHRANDSLKKLIADGTITKIKAKYGL